MNLHAALTSEHSKAQTLRIVEYIGTSRKRFEQLLAIVAGDDKLLSQRGAWVISHLTEAQPRVVQPYLGDLLQLLEDPDLHDAVRRNVMKAAAELQISDDLSGRATDLAFRLLTDPEQPVAIKVYSMSVLEKICQREPALAPELRLTIEHLQPIETKPAFRSRSRQVLKSLDEWEIQSGRA